MRILRSAIIFLIIASSLSETLDTQYGYKSPLAYQQCVRGGNNHTHVNELIHTLYDSTTPGTTPQDAVFEPQRCENPEDASDGWQGVISELPRESVVLEEQVLVPPGTQLITLDIVLGVDVSII